MNKKRIIEIKEEAERRTREWLTHSTFEEMAFGGSLMRFDMALGLNGGYPFEPEPEWMKNFDDFITDEEFSSPIYDSIIEKLYDKVESGNFK